MQFGLIVIAFFVLSLNAIAAPSPASASLVNPLLDYSPDILAQAAVEINDYMPVLQDIPDETTRDQVFSSVITPDSVYAVTPMLVDTIPHEIADRQIRGLRGETVYHTVQQGETLGAIAKQYGINISTLAKENEINPADASKLKPGTKLAIAPENTADGADFFNKLQAEEQKAREAQQKAEQDRQAKLAKSRGTSAKSKLSAVSIARAESQGDNNGNFRTPIGGSCRNGYHSWAVDCPNPPGTGVAAAASGIVEEVNVGGWNGGYGTQIVVNHGNGWKTRYAHLSAARVSVGESVSSGEIIAASGATGNVTGPHLHFEIIKNGQRLNPVSFGIGGR